MNLKFNVRLAENYKSKSQIIRVLSEHWVQHNSYCPSCGYSDLETYQKNNPAADFYCNRCNSDFELKSFKKIPKLKIVDGAYSSMISKVRENRNPNFFFLHYSTTFTVVNYFAIPKFFFTLNIIEKRKPLSEKARRAKWVGCNILFGNLPQAGFIYLIKDGTIINPNYVIKKWEKTSFLSRQKIESRGWLIELMEIIDNIPSITFTIQDVYKFEASLRKKYPNNRFVKEKIRQQLQVLRNKGLIKFLGRGNYKKLG